MSRPRPVQSAPAASLPAVGLEAPHTADAVRDDAPSPVLRSLEYVVVDVETTGASAGHGHRVTEVAAVCVRGTGEVVEEYSTLVNPQRPIPLFITRLTNITDEMVRDAPLFAQIAPRLEQILAGRVFVAHNAAFDSAFLGAELARIGAAPLAGPVLCTLRLARRLVPELPSRSLAALSDFFGVENEAHHRAFGDARATVEVLLRLLDRLDEREIVSWDQLEELLSRRRPRRRHRATPTSMESA